MLDEIDKDWLRTVTDDYYGNMPEPDGSAKYDQLRPYGHTPYVREADEEPWVEPPGTCFSAYSGSTIERSNQRVFLREFPGTFCTFYGGHGTEAIACPLSKVTPEMLEMMNALTDYPILDEEDERLLEMERDDEAWDSWVCRDFVRGLVKRIWNEDEDEDDFAERVESYKGDWRDFFEAAREAANEYWEDDGAQRYVNVSRVVDAVDLDELREFALDELS
jgi:hypothetical protein